MNAAPDSGSFYEINDPEKIQGRDDVSPDDHSLAGLRLQRALKALCHNPRSVLMPGCGAGRYARAMAASRPEWHIVAGDLSPVAIDEARAIGGGPEFTVFDVESISFPNGSFDAVVFFDLLEHVPHPNQLLAECRRVLRPGGILHFFVPLEDQPGTIYRALSNNKPIPIHRWKRDHVGHVQRFRDTDVLRLTWDAGLAVTAVSYSFHLAGQVHDVLDYWHRERSGGSGGLAPLPLVSAITRATFIATWRASYIEDHLYAGPRLASGLHVTARSAGSRRAQLV